MIIEYDIPSGDHVSTTPHTPLQKNAQLQHYYSNFFEEGTRK